MLFTSYVLFLWTDYITVKSFFQRNMQTIKAAEEKYLFCRFIV